MLQDRTKCEQMRVYRIFYNLTDRLKSFWHAAGERLQGMACNAVNSLAQCVSERSSVAVLKYMGCSVPKGVSRITWRRLEHAVCVLRFLSKKMKRAGRVHFSEPPARCQPLGPPGLRGCQTWLVAFQLCRQSPRSCQLHPCASPAVSIASTRSPRNTLKY